MGQVIQPKSLRVLPEWATNTELKAAFSEPPTATPQITTAQLLANIISERGQNLILCSLIHYKKYLIKQRSTGDAKSCEERDRESVWYEEVGCGAVLGLEKGKGKTEAASLAGQKVSGSLSYFKLWKMKKKKKKTIAMQMFLLHRNANCVHWDAADDCPVDADQSTSFAPRGRLRFSNSFFFFF